MPLSLSLSLANCISYLPLCLPHHALRRLFRITGAITRAAARPCSHLVCQFGATCREKGRKAHCVCEDSCPSSNSTLQVCGSDGVTYASECELRLSSCRVQRTIDIVSSQACESQSYSLSHS